MGVTIHNNIYPVFDVRGKVAKFAIVGVDISEKCGWKRRSGKRMTG